MKRIALIVLATCGVLSLPVYAQSGAVKSGPQVGQRPLPFTSNLVTGPNRGKQHCYICELTDEPAVLVFARKLDAPTGRVMRDLRDLVQARRKDKFFGWFVFLSDHNTSAQTETEAKVETFARENGASNLPVSVLGDPLGPPGYVISPDAEVTVLFIRSRKTLANRAFRAGEWNESAASRVLKDASAVFGLQSLK